MDDSYKQAYELTYMRNIYQCACKCIAVCVCVVCVCVVGVCVLCVCVVYSAVHMCVSRYRWLLYSYDQHIPKGGI